MSKLVSEVLPHHVENNREVETHSAGTLIEAAVYMVNQMAGGPQAIKQLAEMVCVASAVISGVMDGTIANPKGLIIELNGKTSSERDRTTPDHEPEFEARCIWPAENHIHEALLEAEARLLQRRARRERCLSSTDTTFITHRHKIVKRKRRKRI